MHKMRLMPIKKRISDEQCKEMLKGITKDSQGFCRMVENLLSITKLDTENVKG